MGKLTPAEKMKRYREKRKSQGLHTSDKESAKTRMKEKRGAETALEATERRRKDAGRKRRKRQSDKDYLTTPDPIAFQSPKSPYNSVQTAGKALKKSKAALPTSPTKQIAIVSKLAEGLGLKVTNYKEVTERSIPIEVQQKADIIQNFYRRDDITWQTPSKKDKVIVKEANSCGIREKVDIPKRYLLMTMREAYRVFTEEYPEVGISFSRFCSYKPIEVDLFSKIPHNVCVCKYHENIRLIFCALNAYVQVPTVFREFLAEVTCSQDEKLCMTHTCLKCATKIEKYNPKNFPELSQDIEISCEQWIMENGRIDKVEMKWSIQECFAELCTQFVPFKQHAYVKRKQESFFIESKQNSDGKTVNMQLDYAQNYAFVLQDEVQSAHWAHNLCSIFTAYCWLDKEDEQGFAIVTDNLVHGKVSVYKFLDILIENVTNRSPIVEKINIFTDGASSQFKSKFIMAILHLYEVRYGIKIHWHYFASSHGKGVVDGIGGTVKSAVWRRAKAGKTMRCAKDFADTAAEACPKIRIIYVPTEEIEENEENLNDHWEDLRSVRNTHRIHSVQTEGCYYKVKVAEESSSDDWVTAILKKD